MRSKNRYNRRGLKHGYSKIGVKLGVKTGLNFSLKGVMKFVIGCFSLKGVMRFVKKR